MTENGAALSDAAPLTSFCRLGRSTMSVREFSNNALQYASQGLSVFAPS